MNGRTMVGESDPVSLGVAMSLSIMSSRQNGNLTVTLAGEIDLLTVPGLNAELAGAAADDSITKICVDLCGVTFTDSTGISSLVAGKQLATESGKQYDVVAARDVIRRVLDLTGVWTYLSSSSD